jgi:hypothetical protein
MASVRRVNNAAGAQMSSTLKAIGFWPNSGPHGFVHPERLIDLSPDPRVRQGLVAYLQSGRLCNGYLGYSFCRFSCGIPFTEMGDCEMTDGNWLWPVGLVHYVRDHDLRLPHDFIVDAESNGWSSPVSGDETLGDHYAYDLSFWRDWCRANASGELRTGLSALTPHMPKNDEL